VPYLADRGVLSVDELLGVLPLVKGEDVFLGVEEPKPTGVKSCLIGLPLVDPLAPDLIDEVRRTPPLGEDSSEFKDKFDPREESHLKTKIINESHKPIENGKI